MKRSYLASLILVVVALPAISQQCSIPSEVPRTRPTRIDHANKSIPVDSYGLAISWSPQFCNTQAGKSPANSWQCVDHSFGFIVHGLWPQSSKATRTSEHPRFCKSPQMLPANVIKPHLCTMASAQLIQDEWNKHGSCAWPNATEYLEQVETLYKYLVMPDLKPGRSTAGAVRKAIVDANRSKGLRPEHTEIRVLSGNRFSEVMICYDKNFQFAACSNGGAPDSVELSIAAKK